MASLGSIINPTLEFLQAGFDHVNAVQGLVIALFATVLMRQWRQLFVMALVAVVVCFAWDTLYPIATKGVNLSQIKLPNPLRAEFWNGPASLYASIYVGFVMIIAAFFAVKKVVFMRGGGAKAKAAH